MARLVQDEDFLQIDAERVDIDNLIMANPLDEDNFILSGETDTDDLITDIGTPLTPFRYRADSIRITADNTSITSDYSL
jgi:hypothetical protein